MISIKKRGFLLEYACNSNKKYSDSIVQWSDNLQNQNIIDLKSNF